MDIVGCLLSQDASCMYLIILHFFNCLVMGRHKHLEIPPPFFILCICTATHTFPSPQRRKQHGLVLLEENSQRLLSRHQFCVWPVNIKGRCKHTWDTTQRGVVVKNSLGCRTNCDPTSHRVLVSFPGSYQCRWDPKWAWVSLSPL